MNIGRLLVVAAVSCAAAGAVPAFSQEAPVTTPPPMAFHAALSADNYIQTEFGDWEAKLRLSLANLARTGDNLYVEPSVLADKWPNGAMTGYTVPIGRTTAAVHYLKADFQFLGNSPLSGLQNNITYAIAQISRPISVTPARTIVLNAGGVRSTSAYVLNEQQTGPTETVTLLTLGSTLMRGTPGKATTNAFVQLSTNFRRSPHGSEPEGEAGRLDLVAGHERWFGRATSLFLFGIGVLSIDPLPLSQKVTIGGPFCVRGYNVNEAMGDQGFLVKTELRHRIPVTKTVPVTVRVMVDDAQVFQKVADPNKPKSDHLLSAGAGLTVPISSHYNLTADWAHRLNHHAVRDGKGGGRIWFGMSATY